MIVGTIKLHRPGPGWQACLEASTEAPEITRLGWDTECTGRHVINLLNAPAEITIASRGKEIHPVTGFKAVSPVKITCTIPVPGSNRLSWNIAMLPGEVQMHFACDKDVAGDVTGIELYVPFNPRVAVVSIITNTWDDEGRFGTPFVASAPDIGQLQVTSRAGTRVSCDIDGNRRWGSLDLLATIPVPLPGEPVVLDITPTLLARPECFTDEPAWRAARRGWYNMLQFSCGASGGSPRVKGVWANNTLSDPVSSLLYMLGDATLMVPELCPGISMAPLLRRAIEYWIDHKTDGDGLVAYTAGGRDQNVMDGNPAVIIAAWCYVEASNDADWLACRVAQLERIALYMEQRDVDGDGIIESKQSGLWGSQPTRDPDCAWDCYVSGHKNAYVNVLAYRAWNCMAALERRLDRNDAASHYQQLARMLKASFVRAFFNPDTGWLGFWRDRDDRLHDIHNDSPTSMATSYGLIGADEGSKMLRSFWTALERTGFNRFDIGVPLNLVPVPRAEMSVYFEFQQFLNGGCCVSNASWLVDGLHRAGMVDQANTILHAMLARQERGVFSNGGGFQNGFIDKMGHGAEVFDWEGRPAGYEGHLVYCWAFLQSMLLAVPGIKARVHPF